MLSVLLSLLANSFINNRYRSIESFVVLGCLWAFLQQMFQSGFTSASSSTIQRAFGLSVTQATFLSTTYNVVKLMFSAILSYVSMRGNVPRHCSWQVFFSGVGCFLYGFPGMLVAMEEKEGGDFPVCNVNGT